MVRRILFTTCLLSCSLMAAAQQSLNIFTTTQGTVTFTFAEEPAVTFPSAETLMVKTETVTIEFPFSEVEKITFEDGLTSVESITVNEGNAPVFIYDLGGRLVRQYKPQGKAATIDLSLLPKGTYVVKDGKRAYKVMKK